MHLLFVSLVFWSDLVEGQSVLVGLHRDESDPVSQLVLLQVLLCQVLQVLTRELGGGDNCNDGAVLLDRDSITQVTSSTIDLNMFNQELSIGSWVENTVLNWRGNIDGESLGNLLFSSSLNRKSLLVHQTQPPQITIASCY